MAPDASLPHLPEDMLVEVAARVTASSNYPMQDLRSLRGVSPLVRDKACGAPLVRRRLRLMRALQLEQDAETRHRLIAKTYEAGNLEARFIEGMRVVHGHAHVPTTLPPLDDLYQAASGGHKPSAFIVSMILWRSNSGGEADCRAKELLARTAEDHPALSVWSDRGVSRIAAHIFDMRMWTGDHADPPFGYIKRPVRRSLRRCPSPALTQSWCGKAVRWDGFFCWSYFCSEECRIETLCEKTFRLLL